MTPEEQENALRAQARRCAEEITEAMSVKPKPKWNAVCPPPILRKHYEKVKPMGVSLVKFVSVIGRMNGRYGVES
ncbi:hypothetical protein AC565_17875 [Klebsiella pneumoniae]|uniref:hypothetical protein n=1 Tax=Klebsiella pneumoniae TaxID=573 RepID=UPI0006ECFBCA|nr:hypothetical protein [Klebsiella pneumoniae]ALH83497.1 hypothetical protein AN966_00870 [Klebsiella pneumoniae]ALP79295.1 hypothetical protein AC565_17875 [Klebsiella pneumoniae]ARA48611.1 hypothetical protein AM447_21735 [Klebsiella pneumoniae]ART12394.1 hypothetical protein B8F96_18265 [Klebsiella pneumoniae]ARX42981.1 hypothetical protein AM390_03680 [Klebsiella pneumoniae]